MHRLYYNRWSRSCHYMGDYLVDLDADSVAIFTPMGLVIKKCRITMNGQPVSLKKLGEMLIITR